VKKVGVLEERISKAFPLFSVANNRYSNSLKQANVVLFFCWIAPGASCFSLLFVHVPVILTALLEVIGIVAVLISPSKNRAFGEGTQGSHFFSFENHGKDQTAYVILSAKREWQ
jgi:hypothetical protein